MAFSDPLPITIGGVTKNLVRIDSGKYTSEYLLSEAAQEFRAVIRSQDLKPETDGRKRVRHNLSIRQTIFATGTSPAIVRNASMTIEHYQGDVVTDFDDVALAVAAQITAANVVKLNNYES
jgi:hypothetical protein